VKPPSRAHLCGDEGTGTTKAILGYIALTDAAPLIAKEKGIFAKYGMPDVDVAKQARGAPTRDNLTLVGSATVSTARIFFRRCLLMTAGKVTQNKSGAHLYPRAAELRLSGDLDLNAYKDLKSGSTHRR